MSGGFLAFRCSNYENTAEREQFRLLCKKMKSKFAKSDGFYLMVGNYNIYDSEFDAIVVKHDAIIAVEFKNYGGNIIARENGDWTSNGVAIRGGSRKTVYQQARVNRSSLRNGLKDLGIEQSWIKDIPSIIVFNQTISLDNQLSGKVRSWLHVTDNAHFIEKLEDITCPSTHMSNIDIINLAIKLNLNTFLIDELSNYSYTTDVDNERQVSKKEERDDSYVTVTDEKMSSEIHHDTKPIIDAYDRFTPNHIFSLRPNQVFVFGTDKKGSQRYGAAGLAAKKIGAQIGVIDGPTGNCYALPTKGFSLSDLEKAVTRFKAYVRANGHLTFLVTPVGCGHAGFNVKQVANMFKDLIGLENVMLPDVFIKEYRAQCSDCIHKEKPLGDVQTKNTRDEVNSFDDIFHFYDTHLHDVIRYLIDNKIDFNPAGEFVIVDESGTVIAEAELGIESEKVVFFPFNSQSERAFKNNGYTISTPLDYLQSKTM